MVTIWEPYLLNTKDNITLNLFLFACFEQKDRSRVQKPEASLADESLLSNNSADKLWTQRKNKILLQRKSVYLEPKQDSEFDTLFIGETTTETPSHSPPQSTLSLTKHPVTKYELLFKLHFVCKP